MTGDHRVRKSRTSSRKPSVRVGTIATLPTGTVTFLFTDIEGMRQWVPVVGDDRDPESVPGTRHASGEAAVLSDVRQERQRLPNIHLQDRLRRFLVLMRKSAGGRGLGGGGKGMLPPLAQAPCNIAMEGRVLLIRERDIAAIPTGPVTGRLTDTG